MVWQAGPASFGKLVQGCMDLDQALQVSGLMVDDGAERWSGEFRLRSVARKLGGSEEACRSRLNRFMKRAGHVGGQWTSEGLWTLEEDEVIWEAMSRKRPGWAQVAADLGRTRAGCATRVYHLGRRDSLTVR